jgi:zona occludens toxin
MPVKLFTGLPGAGKTASLVAEMKRLAKDEPHRPIFQMGINGLKDGIAIELTMEQLHNWREELPPGSIICIDECQEEHLMPKDLGKPARWVQAITKVRHDGIDFLLTTQHPQNMSA